MTLICNYWFINVSPPGAERWDYPEQLDILFFFFLNNLCVINIKSVSKTHERAEKESVKFSTILSDM